jgi:hypothetical protein
VRFLFAVSTCVALVSAPVQIRSIAGGVLHPLEPSGLANVLFFVTSDCPVSNQYAPEINRICAAYSPKGIHCAVVYEDVKIAAADVRRHLDEHGLRTVDAAIDADGSLAARLNATITPEAFVVDHSGATRYRGRIDNFYVAFGRSRQVVTVHDLRDALDALVGGKPVATPSTEPIGCYIVPPNQRSH